MNNANVSIVLPVYNGATYLPYAIQSILDQTYSHFEFIILNDGSTDDSESVIQSYAQKDKRIKYIKNESNLGLIATLNKGFETSSGRYIARMDQDDVADPERIELQIRFLDQLQRPAIVGTNIVVINQKNQVLKIPRKMHFSESENFWVKFRKCPVHHPTVMMSREIWMSFNPIYHSEDLHSEDYSAWLRINKKFPIFNLKTPLLFYRIHDSNISKIYFNPQTSRMLNVLKQYFKENINFTIGIEALECLLFLRLNSSYDTLAIYKEIIESGKKFIEKFGNENFVKNDLAYCLISLGLKSNFKTLFSTMSFIAKNLGIGPLLNAFYLTSAEGFTDFLFKPFYKLKFNRLLKR